MVSLFVRCLSLRSDRQSLKIPKEKKVLYVIRIEMTLDESFGISTRFFLFLQNTYWYDPSVLRQVPPCLQGFNLHSSTSSSHLGPLNPIGHLQRKPPFDDVVHRPPFWHGEEAHTFCLSQ